MSRNSYKSAADPAEKVENDITVLYPDTADLPVRESRCNICTSSDRARIDRLLAIGLGHKEIAEDIVMTSEDFRNKRVDTVRKNVERHHYRHFNARDRALRRIIERRAKEAGIILEEAEGSIVQPRALLDLMVQRATEQITDPDSRIKYDTAVDAVRLLEDFQKSEYQAQLETMQRQVWAISQAIRDLVDPALYPRIKERARQIFENPTVERAVPGSRGVLPPAAEIINGKVEREDDA
jgi:hypothetical protein